ncbi:unnamed protein product [Urochloa humidicola]
MTEIKLSTLSFVVTTLTGSQPYPASHHWQNSTAQLVPVHLFPSTLSSPAPPLQLEQSHCRPRILQLHSTKTKSPQPEPPSPYQLPPRPLLTVRRAPCVGGKRLPAAIAAGRFCAPGICDAC